MVIATLRPCCNAAALCLVGFVAPLGLVGLAACDTVEFGCPTSCIGAAYATFDLACSPNDLESVVATGPCALAAMPEAGLPYYTGTESELLVTVGSPEAGACHVALQFATGFAYETDVTFASQADPTPKGCSPCPAFIGPTGGPWTVNNPGDTCVALPADAGASADAASDVTGE
jgi:hypothetical protein